ncbi:MAG TPA: aquaporin [Thermoanaerobaculia bacterium]|nr:aquaporin [Thermoanaerobaculia bacterium]
MGALLLTAVFDPATPAGRRPRDAGARRRLTVGQRLTFEIVATFFLVLVVCATAIDSRGVFSVVSGLPIGLVITFDILAGGPVIAR